MPRPHLTIHRPSPTTALYTVSTRSPNRTLTTLLLKSLTHLLRLLLGIAIVLILLLKAISSPPAALPTSLIPLHTQLQKTFPWRYILPATVLTLILLTLRPYKTESLLAIRTLGIQTSTLSANYLLPSSTRFIPTSQIRDVLIGEAFLGFEVRYYLAVVVEGEAEVVVVFPGLLPGRAVVEEVWRGARGCLFEAGEKVGEGFG